MAVANSKEVYYAELEYLHSVPKGMPGWVLHVYSHCKRVGTPKVCLSVPNWCAQCKRWVEKSFCVSGKPFLWATIKEGWIFTISLKVIQTAYRNSKQAQISENYHWWRAGNNTNCAASNSTEQPTALLPLPSLKEVLNWHLLNQYTSFKFAFILGVFEEQHGWPKQPQLVLLASWASHPLWHLARYPVSLWTFGLV